VPDVYAKEAKRSPPLGLRLSIERTNAEINAKGESADEFRGMGTTCTALALLPRGAIVGHVGDSRAYQVRGGRIEQLSCDHSLAWELEPHRGQPGGDQLPATPKNIITRSLGPHPKVKVDLEGPFPVEPGDTFVLCSDGLSGQVADEEIGLFAAALPPVKAAAALLGLALVRGAPDNVTVIVARAGEKEATQVAPGDQPWVLKDATAATTEPKPVPWKQLAFAAGSALVGLTLNPFSQLMKPPSNDNAGGMLGGLLAELAFPVGVAIAAIALLLFLASSLAAWLALSPAAAETRILRLGDRLGAGPYRGYDCRPSNLLIEGVVASVEAAADGLADVDRHRLLEAVASARRRLEAGDLPGAIGDAAEAIAIYRRSVEDSRGDDSTIG
jgi:serine/threonine protein phosphatase PrpC